MWPLLSAVACVELTYRQLTVLLPVTSSLRSVYLFQHSSTLFCPQRLLPVVSSPTRKQKLLSTGETPGLSDQIRGCGVTIGLVSGVGVSASYLQMQMNLCSPHGGVVQLCTAWLADQLIGHRSVMSGDRSSSPQSSLCSNFLLQGHCVFVIRTPCSLHHCSWIRLPILKLKGECMSQWQCLIWSEWSLMSPNHQPPGRMSDMSLRTSAWLNHVYFCKTFTQNNLLNFIQNRQ